MNAATVKNYLQDLQNRIVSALEAFDGKPFARDEWTRPQGGGGITRVIEEGNFSSAEAVIFACNRRGHAPSATANRPELAGRAFEAMGVSLVLHPRNPHCPTKI